MQSTTKDEVFSFDVLEEHVEGYFEETEERENASVTYENNILTLTVVKFQDFEVTVYRAPESKELYTAMDDKYLEILKEKSTGNDFWDMWAAMLAVLEPYKIVDEIMNP